MPFRHRAALLLFFVAFLIVSGCAGTRPGTSERAPCTREAIETPLSGTSFSVEEIIDASGQLPEPIGGLSGLLEKIGMPEGVTPGDERVRVLVGFVIDEAGCPRQLEVLESPEEALSEALVEAVQQTRFRPGVLGGTPVAVRMELPATFGIRL